MLLAFEILCYQNQNHPSNRSESSHVFLSFGVNLCFVFDTRGNTKTASGKHYMDFCFSLDDLLSASRKHKTQPSFSPANFVFVQSTVAKPKTKSYTVKKVDRKVFLTTPQHGKNRSICNNNNDDAQTKSFSTLFFFSFFTIRCCGS